MDYRRRTLNQEKPNITRLENWPYSFNLMILFILLLAGASALAFEKRKAFMCSQLDKAFEIPRLLPGGGVVPGLGRSTKNKHESKPSRPVARKAPSHFPPERELWGCAETGQGGTGEICIKVPGLPGRGRFSVQQVGDFSVTGYGFARRWPDSNRWNGNALSFQRTAVSFEMANEVLARYFFQTRSSAGVAREGLGEFAGGGGEVLLPPEVAHAGRAGEAHRGEIDGDGSGETPRLNKPTARAVAIGLAQTSHCRPWRGGPLVCQARPD